MQVVERSYESLTEVKRSKFITHLVPVPEYEGFQNRLKAKQPKANHVVYALRYLNEGGWSVSSSCPTSSNYIHKLHLFL